MRTRIDKKFARPLALISFALLCGGVPSASGGEWVRASNPEGGYASGLSVSPVGPQLVFTRTWQRLARSMDGGRSWEHLSTPVHSTQDLFYDPHGSTRIYGFSEKELHFSADSGTTWSLLPSPIRGGPFSTHVDMAFDTTTPGRAYVLALDGDFFQEVYRIYRTDDGGRAWTLVHEFDPDIFVERLVLPTGSATLLVGTFDGILRSTDAGASFQPVLSGARVRQMRRNPNLDDRVYAVAKDHLFVGQDDGRNWVRRVLPTEAWSIDVAGTVPERLVIAAGRNGVWVSDDRGRNWNHIDTLPDTHSAAGVAVAPWDEGSLIVSDGGGLGVHLSHDGGATWQASNRGLHAPIQRLHVHGDPNAPMLAESLDYIYTSADHGTSWERLPIRVRRSSSVRIAVSPSDPDWIVLFHRDYASERTVFRQSDDGGWTWGEVELPQTMTGLSSAAITPDGALVISDGVRGFLSRNEGRSWVPRSIPQQFGEIRSELQPPSRLFMLGHLGVRISYDHGLNWSPNTLQQQAFDVRFHPRFPLRIFVAGDSDQGAGFSFSLDGGQRWFTSHSSNGLPATRYQRVTIDTTSDNRIAVQASGGLPYLSEDGGRTFERARDGEIDVDRFNLAFDPRDGKLWGTDTSGKLFYLQE